MYSDPVVPYLSEVKYIVLHSLFISSVMPKKFVGENSKAAAAKAKKAAAKDAEGSKKQKEVDDAYWRDDDKQVLKKQQRKDEQEKKKQITLEKKAETKALLEQEMDSIKRPTTKPAPSSKMTRAQIETNKVIVQKKDSGKEKIETHLTAPLEENINRLVIEGDEARTISEAIAILGDGTEMVDKHPEKRLKAAHQAFEARRLAELKIEHPSLRLSQLKHMAFEEWKKSPENPLNKMQK